MATDFTYTPANVGSNARDWIRWRVGDTQGDQNRAKDAEIDAALDKFGKLLPTSDPNENAVGVTLAAAEVCRAIAASLGKSSETILTEAGAIKSTAAEFYLKLSDTLEAEISVGSGGPTFFNNKDYDPTYIEGGRCTAGSTVTAPAISIKVQGLEDVIEKIGGWASRARNLKPALKIVDKLLEVHVEAQFKSEGRRGGKPWKRLSRRTVKARANRWGYYRRASAFGAGATGPILTWSGRLRRSFKRGGSGHVSRVSRSQLVWGSSIRYGRFLVRKRPILMFKNQFQRREVTFQAIRMHLQGVPPGAILTVMRARVRL